MLHVVDLTLYFQDLVEHNPLIAVDVLSKLINSPDMDSYVQNMFHFIYYVLLIYLFF
jgi:hypothetical protein